MPKIKVHVKDEWDWVGLNREIESKRNNDERILDVSLKKHLKENESKYIKPNNIPKSIVLKYFYYKDKQKGCKEFNEVHLNISLKTTEGRKGVFYFEDLVEFTLDDGNKYPTGVNLKLDFLRNTIILQCASSLLCGCALELDYEELEQESEERAIKDEVEEKIVVRENATSTTIFLSTRKYQEESPEPHCYVSNDLGVHHVIPFGNFIANNPLAESYLNYGSKSSDLVIKLDIPVVYFLGTEPHVLTEANCNISLERDIEHPNIFSYYGQIIIGYVNNSYSFAPKIEAYIDFITKEFVFKSSDSRILGFEFQMEFKTIETNSLTTNKPTMELIPTTKDSFFSKMIEVIVSDLEIKEEHFKQVLNNHTSLFKVFGEQSINWNQFCDILNHLSIHRLDIKIAGYNYRWREAHHVDSEPSFGIEISTFPDKGLSPAELEKKYGKEHPKISLNEWKHIVAKGETVLGYWNYICYLTESGENVISVRKS